MNGVMKRIFFLLLVLSPAVASADKVWNAGKGVTWDCKKDPTVTINHGGGTYKFKGACSTLNVNGGGIKITADSIDTVNVTGAKNTVTVGTVGTIAVTGTKNKVTWKTPKSGDAPTISDVGRDNTIAQVGGAAKPATPATPPAATTPAPAAPAGAIDCGKTATHMISDNDRNLTYVGKCDTISLDGNNITIKAESVKNLAVSGNDNKATVDAADKIYTPGNNNTVTYKKGISAAKPKLANPGNDNSIRQIK